MVPRERSRIIRGRHSESGALGLDFHDRGGLRTVAVEYLERYPYTYFVFISLIINRLLNWVRLVKTLLLAPIAHFLFSCCSLLFCIFGKKSSKFFALVPFACTRSSDQALLKIQPAAGTASFVSIFVSPGYNW